MCFFPIVQAHHDPRPIHTHGGNKPTSQKFPETRLLFGDKPLEICSSPLEDSFIVTPWFTVSWRSRGRSQSHVLGIYLLRILCHVRDPSEQDGNIPHLPQRSSSSFDCILYRISYFSIRFFLLSFLYPQSGWLKRKTSLHLEMPDVLFLKTWEACHRTRPSFPLEGSARRHARCCSWASGSLGCEGVSCWTEKARALPLASLVRSEPAWSGARCVGLRDRF